MFTCNEQAHVHTKIASSEKINEILGISNAPFPAPLCTHHYYLVYDTLQPKVVYCSLCKSSLKGVAARHCPDPQRVQKYLEESIGFRGKITDDASLCMSCYKSHLQILKKVPLSTDDDLLSIILNLKGSITLNEDLPCAEAVVNKAVYSTAVYVGERLIEQEALLLPAVYIIFTDFLSQFQTEVNVESEVSEKNARWLLSNLIIHLQHHFSYAVRVKKLGTILYRSNGDLLTTLSLSLHKQKSKPQKCNCTCNDPISTKNYSDKINTHIHQQIRKYLAADVSIPFEFDQLNIDQLVAEIDPKLWEFVCMITRPMSACKGYTYSSGEKNSLLNTRVKKVRRFFCLCVLLFCTDDRCHLPLHALITDAVESYGGSAMLIRMLNRLGACSSADTLARVIQYRVEEREKRGVEQDCNPNEITIISVDNIDFLHSYAQVYCGAQTSSWHGTTVQAVQPKPNTWYSDLTGPPPTKGTTTNMASPMQTMPEVSPIRELISISQGECASAIATYEIQNHSECLSDSPPNIAHRKRTASRNSPHSAPSKTYRSPAPKVRRRERTGLEGKTHSTYQTKLTECDHPTQYTQRNALKLPGFQQSASEEAVLQTLREQMELYILLQYHVHKQLPHHFELDSPVVLNIQDYMKLLRPVIPDKSSVVYLKVLDAKSDSKDTLMQILHELYQQFIIGHEKKNLVLVADAKLYKILQSLKFEYGKELQWVIPFPGDWYLLMNYQKVLMKPYFDAGLKQLAQVAGYPAAAIQSCSQFKRTHKFLIEVWQAVYQVMVQRFLEVLTASPNSSENTESLTTAIESEILQSIYRSDIDLCNSLAGIHDLMKQSKYHTKFSVFLDNMAATDPTWRLWIQFIFSDALAYVGLFLAIRSGNWDLRLACIKLMVPVFSAFDHLTYKKLIAQHLADVLSLPQSILDFFHIGGFVVSLTANPWHSVALDEAHEMKINKQCKIFMIRPSEDYIKRIAGYIPYRAKCMENLRQELAIECFELDTSSLVSLLTTKSQDKKAVCNMQAQINLINSTQHLPLTCGTRRLLNPYSNSVASPEQEHDLLHFRSIGQEEYEKYINYFKSSQHKPTTACLWIQNLCTSNQFFPLLQGWTHTTTAAHRVAAQY